MARCLCQYLIRVEKELIHHSHAVGEVGRPFQIYAQVNGRPEDTEMIAIEALKLSIHLRAATCSDFQELVE